MHYRLCRRSPSLRSGRVRYSRLLRGHPLGETYLVFRHMILLVFLKKNGKVAGKLGL